MGSALPDGCSCCDYDESVTLCATYGSSNAPVGCFRGTGRCEQRGDSVFIPGWGDPPGGHGGTEDAEVVVTDTLPAAVPARDDAPAMCPQLGVCAFAPWAGIATCDG
jgi:hypothetical protein